MNTEEIEKFKRTSWGYFVSRCRRIVPERQTLLREFDEVCAFFAPITDAVTNEELFRESTLQKVQQTRLQIAMGALSDPEPHTGVHLYIPECADDSPDGETHWRCARGTNSLEGFHRYLRDFLAHHQCGPELAYNLLRHFIFRWNARTNKASCLPTSSFYQHELIEEIVEVTSTLYESPEPIFDGFRSTKYFKSTEERFGIVQATASVYQVALVVGNDHDAALPGVHQDSPSSAWLARQEGVHTATLRISTRAEQQKFAQELPHFRRGADNPDPDQHHSVDFVAWAAEWNKSVDVRERSDNTIVPPQDVIHRTTANLLQQHYRKVIKELNIQRTLRPYRDALQAASLHQPRAAPAWMTVASKQHNERAAAVQSIPFHPRVAPPPDVLLLAVQNWQTQPAPVTSTPVTGRKNKLYTKRAKIHTCKTCGHAKAHGPWGTRFHPPRGGCVVPVAQMQPIGRRMIGWCDCSACEAALLSIPNAKKPRTDASTSCEPSIVTTTTC